MVKGELIQGNIIVQAHQVIQNLLTILEAVRYGTEHVVRCGGWLDDPRDFQFFNQLFKEYFGENPLARACVVSGTLVDCR